MITGIAELSSRWEEIRNLRNPNRFEIFNFQFSISNFQCQRSLSRLSS